MSGIILTVKRGEEDVRWGLLPAEFSAEELIPYRHVMAVFDIQELQDGERVRFSGHCDKGRVIRFLDGLVWLFDNFFIGPPVVIMDAQLQRRVVAVMLHLLLTRLDYESEQRLSGVLDGLMRVNGVSPTPAHKEVEDKTVSVQYGRLGQLVADRRRGMNLTQQEVAAQAQMSRNYIGLIERGDVSNVSVEVITRLAGALRLPPTSLFAVMVQ